MHVEATTNEGRQEGEKVLLGATDTADLVNVKYSHGILALRIPEPAPRLDKRPLSDTCTHIRDRRHNRALRLRCPFGSQRANRSRHMPAFTPTSVNAVDTNSSRSVLVSTSSCPCSITVLRREIGPAGLVLRFAMNGLDSHPLLA
jgi:hypothetical protein